MATAQVACNSQQAYVKIIKKTEQYAAYEFFKIFDGAQEVYSSPSLTDYSERVIETCLPKSTNLQYTVKLISTTSGWTDGAWIKAEGFNGNVIFKHMMTDYDEDVYGLSLYSPINKNENWKMSSNPTGTWKDVNYSDTNWSEVTLGTTPQTTTGTQYFRHAFAGISVAAIDLQMKYQYGIIAYINGVEVFRDNMATGDATAATLANGSYSTADFRGVIRPASVAENPSSMLAVEVHFMEASHQETIVFDAFLSFLAGISETNKCFVVPFDPVVTGTVTDPGDAFNWKTNYYAYTSTPGAYFAVDYTAVPNLPIVNGVRMWASSYSSYLPVEFSVGISDSPSGPFNTIYATDDALYEWQTWTQFRRTDAAPRLPYYRVTVQRSLESSMYIFGVQFLVCNYPPVTSIPYTQTKTSFFRNYEEVVIKPDMFGFTGCSINPALPAGLTLNTVDCSVSGMPTEARAQQVYTVTSTVGTVTATGTFTLTVEDCAGSLYMLTRTYKYGTAAEYFRIYDSSNMNILFDLPANHGHPANVVWNQYLCITVDRFDVALYSTSNSWRTNSYLYIYYLLPNNEQEMVLKMRYDADQNNIHNVYLRRPVVGYSEQWKYKFDSIPANWYTADVFNSWSQNTRGNFGAASNKVQLFAKTFNVNNLSEVKGLILSIRYKYGCVVYLNGHEAFRNHIEGTAPITSTSQANNVYSDVKFHIVTLPGKSIPTTAQPTAINYLQQGVNTIAIALVAIADTQTTVDFDCIVRLMPSDDSESHIWEFTATTSGQISGTASNPFSMDGGNRVSYSSSTVVCAANSLTVTLDDDRREWVSSLQIQNAYNSMTMNPTMVKVYACNGCSDSSSEGWTLLKDVTGLTWSIAGQKRRVYFQNNLPYNQFRFENFGTGSTTDCKWAVESLDFFADNTMVELEPLTYPASAEIYKDIEMSEIIPSGDGYGDFAINPPLPTGVHLDSQTGWISGTATDLASSVTYTITANKYTGGSVTVTFQLSVQVCTGGRSLMTARFRADSYKAENSWKLYQGKGTTGTVLQQVDEFPVSSTYYYVDFCLNDGIYTLEGRDSNGDGWASNSGYTLSVDLGAMELEIQELPASTATPKVPVTVTSVFSTFFPFQVQYTEWKVYQSGEVPAGWNTPAFDDSTWTTYLAKDIPTTNYVTTYIRKTFTLTNIADYQLMNVRVKYTGGVAAYFNGNMVARFNLQDDFISSTESIGIHDIAAFSKFHIVLPTSGIVEGVNVIAFEIHRPLGTASSEPVVFDATGVFALDDCSATVDSYAVVESTELTSGSLNGIIDLDPYTTGVLPKSAGTYLEWTVENLLGSKWNAFNILQGSNIPSWGFKIDATFDPDNAEDEPITAVTFSGVALQARTKPNYAVPVALAGFRKYRFEITASSSATPTIGAMYGAYCKATGATCPAIDNYPAVAEGQISVGVCPAGYRGYSYRQCSNGVLGEIKMDQCKMKIPANPHYSRAFFEFVMDTQVTTGVPTLTNVGTKWYIDEGVFLPDGLTLNTVTGEISGTPKKEMDLTSYTIYVENQTGAASCTVTMMVRLGQCATDGKFPNTQVGKVAEYECAIKGAYVGTQKAACILGKVDGEWQKPTGICMSIPLIVVIIVVVIVIIVAIVLMIIRASKKTKAVGGVKGKKSLKSSTDSKKAGKMMKV